MNATSPTVPCVSKLTQTLCEHMRRVHDSACYNSREEILETLVTVYRSHLYIKGNFMYDDGALNFTGDIADFKTSIRVNV